MRAVPTPHERDGEPVPERLREPDLVLHVAGHVGESVALTHAPLVRDLVVATGERHRLEGDERDLLGVVQREPDDRADLVVVDGVDEGGHQDDLDAGIIEVVDRLELDVEQVPHLAMAVRVVADAVELEVDETESRPGRLEREIRALGELDSVGGGLDGVVPDVASVLHRA
jgi:hypothetical protein